MEGHHTGINNSSRLDRLDHAIEETGLGLIIEATVASVLETDVLLWRLHLRVSPLDHHRVAGLVRHSMHNGNWNAINFAQIDRLRVPFASGPFL